MAKWSFYSNYKAVFDAVKSALVYVARVFLVMMKSLRFLRSWCGFD